MIPQKDQILEWAENPVTIYFKSLVEKEIKYFEEAGRSTHVFHPFEPQKTQEILASVNAAVDTWEQVIQALEGDFSEFSSEDESEPE